MNTGFGGNVTTKTLKYQHARNQALGSLRAISSILRKVPRRMTQFADAFRIRNGAAFFRAV